MCKDLDHSKYFRSYRAKLGFTNQDQAKKFLGGKDICASVDMAYARSLSDRICDIIAELNKTVHQDARHYDIVPFCEKHVNLVFDTVVDLGLLPRLNNQGRRPEQVLFSWLRGHAVAQFLVPTLSNIFEVDQDSFRSIGDDDFRSADTFARTPRADYEILRGNGPVVLEIQTGYQGVNDIKQHKVLEAKSLARETGKPTVCVHLDAFNGQTAFVRLDQIEDHDVNWVTRQQMEGQTVFAIDQNYFHWRIMASPPRLNELALGI